MSHDGSGYGSSEAPIVVPLVKLQLAAGVNVVAFAHRLLAGTVTAPATYLYLMLDGVELV
jgi:hypothetical protein